MPDPELLIRTSGEQSASTLLWQLKPHRLYITDLLWPVPQAALSEPFGPTSAETAFWQRLSEQVTVS
jgi:hypothetical protein